MGKGALNRILLNEDEVDTSTNTATIPPGCARSTHILEVLRLSPGDTIRAAVPPDRLLTATLLPRTTSTSPIRLSLTSVSEDTSSTANFKHARPRPALSLMLALPRPRVARRCFSAAAQLGVDRIILTRAIKTEASYWDSHHLSEEAVSSALKAGVSQAGIEASLPGVFRAHSLCSAVEEARVYNAEFRIVAHPYATRSLGEVLTEARESGRARSVVLAIGPDGGWTDTELQELTGKYGFTCAGVGERVLATDVALTVLITVVHEHLRQCARLDNTPAHERPVFVGDGVEIGKGNDGKLKDKSACATRMRHVGGFRAPGPE